jgi:predicted transcriptional regulator
VTDLSTSEDVARSERDEAAVSQFVERFSSILVDAGWPRMPARVFVTLVASESAQLTASELADLLVVSPAAISGAVRVLIQLGLIRREREPGSRRDVFRVEDDVWYHVVNRRLDALTRWGDHLSVGVAAVGPNSAAGDRLGDMVDFFGFLREEMPAMMNRWRDRKKN